VSAVKEFGFELRVCAWAERNWPPGAEDGTPIVARQLGTKRRRWDTIVVETAESGLAERAPFGEARLGSDLLFLARHAPASWAYYRECLPDPGYPWRYVREAIHEADDRGFLETRRDGNRIEIRRRYRYPEWVDRIVAIENKPDLDAAAARRLGEQLEHDVALGLADEVWLATEATAEGVEPALLEAMPVEVGILAVSPESGSLSCEPVWRPRTLAAAEPGTRILGRPGDGRSAARFEYADPAWKRRKRLEIAERAYERGWRSYAGTMRPDCRHFELTDPTGPFPRCAAKGRPQTAAECSGSCPAFEPEPPAWRDGGWPIAGGPGRAAKRLLDRKRDRKR
jgi:hypothetical protein